MPQKSPVIAWFRNDLRIGDNPMLHAALETGHPVIPIYILDAQLGGAARWWLHQSLTALGKQLKNLGCPLLLKSGNAEKTISKIISETGANGLFWNRCYDAAAIERDTRLKQVFSNQGLSVASFNGALLHEPWEIRNKSGNPFSVFTPFWRHVRSLDLAQPLEMPLNHMKYNENLNSDTLDSWKLLPTKSNWATGFPASDTIGEAAAQERLETFLEDSLDRYAAGRDVPAVEATSHLSPHLRWGEISPRQIWATVEAFRANTSRNVDADAEKFLAELGWREFCYHLLYRYPDIATKPIRPEFADFPWQPDPAALKAWQQGKTGYAIVDAGMRELWATGTMHNRVRMVTASFLIKHLLQPWQDGAAWFMDTLLDADLASNSANWQWVAGCGADAAPYFRIFNPILQGQKFDPHGTYIRRWVPERAHLTKAEVHLPINPIIEHDFARRRALDAFATLRQDSPS